VIVPLTQDGVRGQLNSLRFFITFWSINHGCKHLEGGVYTGATAAASSSYGCGAL
jgi:hypothetical protein